MTLAALRPPVERENRRLLRRARAIASSLECRLFLAGSLVRDVNAIADSSSEPHGLTSGVGVVYFADAQPSTGLEAYRTDGTSAGTMILRDIRPGPASSDPHEFTLLGAGGATVFVADDGVHGSELWRTDGTSAGTQLLVDIAAGAAASNPMSLTAVNGVAYFVADDGIRGLELWRSDGTTAGTTIVSDFSSAATGDASFTQPTAFAGMLLVGVNTGVEATSGLYRVDASGPLLLKDAAAANLDSGPQRIVAGTSAAYASDGQGRVWKTDGTVAGTVLINTTNTSVIADMAMVGTTLYYVRQTSPISGRGTLYRYDGATVSTVTGSGMSDAGTLLGTDARLYFTANSIAGGYEVWSTTPASTSATQLADLAAGDASSDPTLIRAVGSSVYLTATVSGVTRLYVTSGAAPTALTTTINAPAVDQNAVLTGQLFFVGEQAATGRELWKSNGTAAGTAIVRDLFAGTHGSRPDLASAVTLNGKLLYLADDGASGEELWASDGSAAGTIRLRDIAVGAASSWITGLCVVGSRAYFSADDGTSGAELWTTDGTPAGTVRIADINAGADSSAPGGFVAMGGLTYFFADDGATGTELWRTDGTAAGTQRVAELIAGPDGQWFNPSPVAIGGAIYFSAMDASGDIELWRSDGTAVGTSRVVDLNATGSSSPESLFAFGSTLLFSADDGIHGREPFALNTATLAVSSLGDLNTGGDASPRAFVTLNGRAYFAATSIDAGEELWSTNGTPAGTARVADINPGDLGSSLSGLVAMNDRLYFLADDGVHGRELFTSDGTTAGTHLVADIAVGDASSASGSSIAVANGRLFFVADDGASGSELWTSNGSAVAPTGELNPGAASGAISDPIAIAGNVYFAGDDGLHGSELFVQPDVFAPEVTRSAFEFETGQRLVVLFNEPLQAPPTWTLRNTTSGVVLSPSAYSVTAIDRGFAIAPAAGQTWADGDYELLVSGVADLSGNVATPAAVPFFVLAGDANRDRRVNFDDLLILAAHYNTAGTTWSTGDFTYDGTVTFDDLLVLASRYNLGLSAAAPISAPPAPAIIGGAADPDDRPAADVLA
jgi:ELWxxDGT repeat protein